MRNYVCKLISGSINDYDLSSLDVSGLVSCWDEVYGELQAQTVHNLPTEYMLRLPLSSEQRNAVFQYTAIGIKNFHNVMRTQSEVISLLSEAGIPVAVLKGGAAAMYYPHPQFRQMGDIDIIVPRDDFDRAFDLMVSNGYYHDASVDAMYRRHASLWSGTGVEVELHRYFSVSDSGEFDKRMDEFIFEGLANCSSVDVGGYSVSVLPSMVNGLVLLAHINHHLHSGLGLRQIVDWMCFVKSCLDDNAWSGQFCSMAEQVGLKRLAIVTTRMCKIYLRLDGVTWCDAEFVDSVDGGVDRGAGGQTEIDETAGLLLDYIFAKGNFGRKDDSNLGNGTVAVSTMHNLRNPVAFWRYLNQAGQFHWRATQKYPFLKPFAWIYQIGHIIRVSIKRRAGVRQLSAEMKRSRREVELMKRLGVTRM